MKPMKQNTVLIPVVTTLDSRSTKATLVTIEGITLGLHRAITGTGWTITDPRSGYALGRGPTRDGAIAHAAGRIKGNGTEAVLALMAKTPAAPPVDKLKPAKPKGGTVKNKGGIDPDRVALNVACIAALDDTEKAAVVRALASTGKHRGQLLSKPPGRDADPLAYAAWQGLQPNPWKISMLARFLPPSPEAAALLDKLSKHHWPVWLDRDAKALASMGVF